MEQFSPAEQQSLAPFFTNLTEPVFGLSLPQEVAGALFSRYSRSNKSLRRIFLDEFLGNFDLLLDQLSGGSTSGADHSAALKKAREFYDRVLIGYGDDSVAQLGGAHVACEQISNVAAKLLEDARIGIAPLEKSTRYVRFDAKSADGDYLFYKEPRIMASPHRDAYLSVMRLLFETYAAQIEPMIDVRARKSAHRSGRMETSTDRRAAHVQRARLKMNNCDGGRKTAYRSTVRAQACDVLRSYLPAATLTNVGHLRRRSGV